MRRALFLVSCFSLAGCLVGPNYRRPSAPTPVIYKETQGWALANPSDAADRKDWWTVFNDSTLNALEARVEISNQNIIAAEAAYRQAVALVRIDRASLFPTIGANASVNKSGGGGRGGSVTVIGNSATTTSGGAQYSIGLGGSWAPDLWGGIRRTIEGARASAQASAGQIANARLSAQSELALDYIQLRQDDEQIRLLNATVVGYQRNVAITQNKYDRRRRGRRAICSPRGPSSSPRRRTPSTSCAAARQAGARHRPAGGRAARGGDDPGGLLDAGLAHAAARGPQHPPRAPSGHRQRPNATSPPPTPRSACRRPPTIPASTSPAPGTSSPVSSAPC